MTSEQTGNRHVLGKISCNGCARGSPSALNVRFLRAQAPLVRGFQMRHLDQARIALREHLVVEPQPVHQAIPAKL
jgi:hypothetical protein